MANNYDDADGVWRTIGGRRVFIRKGQSLSEAMIQSGKFKNLRSDYRKAKEEEKKLEDEINPMEEFSDTKGDGLTDAQRKQLNSEKKNINSNEAVDELMNADTGDWNNMNQAERDKTCEKILNDFEDKYGDKLKDEKFRKEVLDGLEDQNFHTMGKIIEQKYEYSNDETLNDLDNRIAKATREEEIKAKQEAVNKSFEENQKELQKQLSSQEYNDAMNKEYQDLKNGKIDYEEYMKNTDKLMDDYYANKDASKSNWRDEIAKNNEQLEKDLKAYQDTHDMARENEGYYELFRENERRNAKIKQEEPNEPYEFVEAYAGYRAKRDKLEGIERDANGRVDWDNVKDATWTGKEYTNDEFLENLEDENWHTERKMLLDANLTNKQMEFVKNHTEFHNGSPNLDREITEELIKGAKGGSFRNPKDIITTRRNAEIEKLTKDLDTASKNGTGGMTATYSSLKERYKNLTGKDYDDSSIKIPYDAKKEYKDKVGNVINQDLMKDHLAGFTADEVKNRIESEKSFLMNYTPEDREINNAYIKEMEKYYNGMEKYESRISNDFTTENWKEGYGNQFGEGSWKGSKSNSGLHGKDKIKAIDDEIKKAYPGIKTSRKTHQGGYTDSFSYDIMESDKPIIRSINDFSDAEIDRLYNSGYNKNTYNTKEEFKESIKKDLERGQLSVNQYNIDNDYRLTPYGKQVFKDIVKVSNAYNYDESASQVDYFNTGHYISLGVGKYNKPYEVTQKTTNLSMNDKIRDEAYRKYMKDHPNSKMTLDKFLKKKK